MPLVASLQQEHRNLSKFQQVVVVVVVVTVFLVLLIYVYTPLPHYYMNLRDFFYSFVQICYSFLHFRYPLSLVFSFFLRVFIYIHAASSQMHEHFSQLVQNCL